VNPEHVVKSWLSYFLAGLLILTWFPLLAQEADENERCTERSDAETCLEEDSGIDTDGSIDDAESSIGDAV